MRRALIVSLLVVVAAVAAAAPAAADEAAPAPLRASLQLDLGLAVVGAGYEHPVTPHLAIMAEGQVFSTYFMPWFDAGARVDGQGAGLRLTWFRAAGGRGLYVTPYARLDRVTAAASPAAGVGFSIGAAAGWAFRPSAHVDVRIGGGAQYLRYRLDEVACDSPFVQLDLVVAYRL